MKKYIISVLAALAIAAPVFAAVTPPPPPPPPPSDLPTSKDQCKNGGWENYGVFKNQGDCVSFVATDGKNQPDGAR